MYSDTTRSLRKIRLNGFLGKKFGRVHHLAVDTPAEAIRALCALFSDFRSELERHEKTGYRFVIGNDALERETLNQSLHMTHDVATIFELTPVINGAKSGWAQVLIGAALVIGAFWSAGWSLSAMGTAASASVKIGAAMMLGGVSQLLTPKVGAHDKEAADNKPSYVFNGAVNTIAQGNPVPILYGRMRVGSQVISAGITSKDIPL